MNKRFPFEELAAIKHGHITLEQIRPFLGEEAFASYFKFAFVRNPFDRFVSYCAFMTRADGAFLKNPQQVMRYILFQARPMQHILFQPQHSFVTDGEGRLLADEIGRVEDMQAFLRRDLRAHRHRLGAAGAGQQFASRQLPGLL